MRWRSAPALLALAMLPGMAVGFGRAHAEEVTSAQTNVTAPADPAARAAFDALDKHCARCHQAGPNLKRQKPAKNFGNILKLDEIARDPDLILPGNPDGSGLFIQIAKKDMPYDCYQEFDCEAEPTETDVKAVYDWIKDLGDQVTAACADRAPIDEAAIVSSISSDIGAQEERRRKGMRYVTLTHFYNACAADGDMARYRQGVVKLLNSLSRNPEALKMRTIDPQETIIAFNLADLAWTGDDWARIVGGYPYGMQPDVMAYNAAAAVTGSKLPWVRGDWLAFAASRAPLYYDLLKLPESFAALERKEGVDVKANIEAFLARRAGFQKSGVSKHNRLIERHSIPTGYFWTSYDFKGDKPAQSLFVHPLGPYGDDAFKHDGGETLFSLPNGFQAYYLNTADGERLSKGPTEIVLDDSQRDRAVTNAISCFGCHNQGIRQASDDIRRHVLHDNSFPEHVRKAVAALYAPPEEMKTLLDRDAARFREAMLSAGLNPDLDSETVGVESINVLSKAYEKSVDLRIAAAEYGLTAEALAEGLAKAGGEAGRMKRRLEQGVLPREILEVEFKDLVAKVSPNKPIEIASLGPVPVARPGEDPEEEFHDFDLALTSDKSTYRVNELPIFTISSAKDCHLTLINVEANGDGTVIFPNTFQQDSLIPANTEVKFPGDDAPFKFRLKDPGTETVIAICNATGVAADGIEHDFKTRQFTPLGNYRNFLTRKIVVEGASKIAAGQKDKAAADDPKTPKDAAASGDDEVLARTAIKLVVR
ncbi:MAG: DUF4384 domain-containing protein [Methyloceanibacter sp.]|uniref:DUF4384 domain-containing protein n=1 Tax=Methyloceanibacter sp. TaxID=1965321 RepID=UPI003D6C8685